MPECGCLAQTVGASGSAWRIVSRRRAVILVSSAASAIRAMGPDVCPQCSAHVGTNLLLFGGPAFYIGA